MFDIIHLLTGDPSVPPTLDAMIELYVAKRKCDLENLIWHGHYRSPSEARDLISVYGALPEPSRIHFLLSPATYAAVYQSKNRPLEGAELLVSYARDELSFVNGQPVEGQRTDANEIWSPNGDRVLIRENFSWTQRSAAALDSLIVIDFESPFARAMLKSPVMYLPAENFSAAEREDVTAKLETAYR
jgi:hypothetical protein